MLMVRVMWATGAHPRPLRHDTTKRLQTFANARTIDDDQLRRAKPSYKFLVTRLDLGHRVSGSQRKRSDKQAAASVRVAPYRFPALFSNSI